MSRATDTIWRRPVLDSDEPWTTTLLAEFRARLALWRRRTESRRMLARCDDHMLRDIGISRRMVLEETRKRFWQA